MSSTKLELLKSIEAAEDSAWAAFRNHMDSLARMKQSIREKLDVESSEAKQPLQIDQNDQSGKVSTELKKEMKQGNEVPAKRVKVDQEEEVETSTPPAQRYQTQTVRSRGQHVSRRLNWERPPARYMRGKIKPNIPKQPCKDCEGFLRAADLTPDEINMICKHKVAPKRPPTPPNWWNPGWNSPSPSRK